MGDNFVRVCQSYSDAHYPAVFTSFEIVGGGGSEYGVVGEARDGLGAAIHLTLDSKTNRILSHYVSGVIGGSGKKRKKKPRN